ncbi:hypothetical protein Tcan_04183 [Toxocara canis]|uniref:Uncharacterized protein n=1 Tax=Toxocara canis TaxID=6265 RepID=A0A0B2VUE3_TOXCA|nr:hypothetical protein Tcan_04183 [Toxocara canis]
MLPPVCTFLTPAPPHVKASSIRYPLSIRDQHDSDIVWIYPCPSKLYPIHCPTSGKIVPIIEHMRQRLPSYPIEKASLQTICGSQPSTFPPSNSRYYSHGYVSSLSRCSSLQSGGYQIALEPRLPHDFQSNHAGNLFRRKYATRFPMQQHLEPNPASPYDLPSNVSAQSLETVGTVTQCLRQTDSVMPCTPSNGASTCCIQSCDVPYSQSITTSYRLMLPYPRYSGRSSCALHSAIQAATNSAASYVKFEGCPVYAHSVIPCACNQHDAELIQSSCLASCFDVFETESAIYSSEKSNEHK